MWKFSDHKLRFAARTTKTEYQKQMRKRWWLLKMMYDYDNTLLLCAFPCTIQKPELLCFKLQMGIQENGENPTETVSENAGDNADAEQEDSKADEDQAEDTEMEVLEE